MNGMTLGVALAGIALALGVVHLTATNEVNCTTMQLGETKIAACTIAPQGTAERQRQAFERRMDETTRELTEALTRGLKGGYAK